MKNFTLVAICLLFSACFDENKKEEKAFEAVIRFSESTIKVLITKENAPQTSEHLINLIKANIYDGGQVIRNESLIMIQPIKNSNDLSKVKIPMETKDKNLKGGVFGLVISPILEQGDSTLFLCLKNCLDLGERYIPVGTLEMGDDSFSSIKSGQKVLTILLKDNQI